MGIDDDIGGWIITAAIVAVVLIYKAKLAIDEMNSASNKFDLGNGKEWENGE